MVRAKFKVNSYETRLDRQEELRTIKLSAVTGHAGDSEENKKYFKYTPWGEISLGTLNKNAWQQLPLGAEVYVELIGSTEEKTTADDYFVGFYTKDCPEGTLDGIRVRIDKVRQTDMKQAMNVNLCEHPLYPDLVAYVLANPLVVAE